MKPQRTIPAIGKQVKVDGWDLEVWTQRAAPTHQVGSHGHSSYRDWSDWLRAQSKTRERS